MDLHIPLPTQSGGVLCDTGENRVATTSGHLTVKSPAENSKPEKMPENAAESPIHTLLASRLVKRPYGLPIQQARTLQLAEQYR